MLGSMVSSCLHRFSTAFSSACLSNAIFLMFIAKRPPFSSASIPLLSAKETNLSILTVAERVTNVFPLGILFSLTYSYFWILPEESDTISSATNWSFSTVVLADTKVPYACSMALRKALKVASSLSLPSPDTTKLTSFCAQRVQVPIHKATIIISFFIISILFKFL